MTKGLFKAGDGMLIENLRMRLVLGQWTLLQLLGCCDDADLDNKEDKSRDYSLVHNYVEYNLKIE